MLNTYKMVDDDAFERNGPTTTRLKNWQLQGKDNGYSISVLNYRYIFQTF